MPEAQGHDKRDDLNVEGPCSRAVAHRHQSRDHVSGQPNVSVIPDRLGVEAEPTQNAGSARLVAQLMGRCNAGSVTHSVACRKGG